MIFAGIALSLGAAWWSRIIDDRRDAVVSGMYETRTLSLALRWQTFWDWLLSLASIVGLFTFNGFAFIAIARLSGESSVTWLAYFATAFSFWGASIYVFVGFSDGLLAVTSLRKAKAALEPGE